MLDRRDITELLVLQSRGYLLLMWLDEQSVKSPQLLSVSAVALLREAKSAAIWIEGHRSEIPPGLLPTAEQAERFWNLFASFFSTSFQVQRLEFDDRLLDARLKLGTDDSAPSRSGLEGAQALALKHLAASAGMHLDVKDARRIVKRAALHNAALIWTYVWELDRRARHKGKGPVAHRLWRSLPWSVKKTLDVDAVWTAREALLAAAQTLPAQPP